jgi:hypothetical protein
VEDYTVNLKTATATCNAPTTLATASITTSGATLSWAAVSGASNYTLQIKPSTSTTWTSYTVTGANYTATGLSASTIYNWQVRTNCTSGSSAYTAGTNFTTGTTSTCSDNYESNNTLATAPTVTVNTNLTARIGTSSDIDWYKFTNTTAARNIRVTLTNLPADYDLYLYNSAGTLLYSSENGSTTAETVTFNAAPVGTYYIRVIGYNSAFSGTACYTFRATTSGTTLREEQGELQTTPKEVALETAAPAFDVNLFPNPANNVLNILVATTESTIKGQALDATGRIIWTGYLDNGVNTININELPAGIYHFVAFQGNGERVSKTFVKVN